MFAQENTEVIESRWSARTSKSKAALIWWLQSRPQLNSEPDLP